MKSLVLNKRIIREFKENKVRYLGLILLILISSMLIVGIPDSTDCIMDSMDKYFIENNCEDGEFVVKTELNNITITKLKELGADIEEKFYYDFDIDENKTIRIFKERESINKLTIASGRDIKSDNEIILDRKFGEVNNYRIGNCIQISDKVYSISGYGTVPDYTLVKKNSSDLVASPENFGIAFVSGEDFRRYKDVTKLYSFTVDRAHIDDVKYILKNNCDLLSFEKRSDNASITGYKDDLNSNKRIAIMVGVLLCFMIGFIISISLISIIDKESAIIGALYSLGYVKKELLKHFMILPTIVVASGSIIGMCAGFLIEKPLELATADNYCFPNTGMVYPAYLIALGTAAPIAIVILVNYIVLSKRLNSTPLQLLRKEKKEGKLSGIQIRHFGFITKFRLRFLLREIKSNIILFIGISFSMLILILGLGMHDGLSSYISIIEKQANIENTYIFNMPIHVKNNETTEKCFVKSLSMYFDELGQTLDVNMQGIEENTKFYDFHIKEDDDGAYVSQSLAAKFNLKIGDILKLKDKVENRTYKIKIKGTLDYNIGLYIFMNIKQINKLMDKDNSYYNGCFSREKLNINKDYVYSTITSEDMIKSAKTINETMAPMQILLITFSTILLVLMMYLLLKLMIDKSLTGISLIKVFGFNQKEINKLYLGSYLYTIILCLLIAIPISVNLYKLIWPHLIANMPTFIFVNIKPITYLYIAFITLGSYFISNVLLKQHINKISLAEALKNRE